MPANGPGVWFHRSDVVAFSHYLIGEQGCSNCTIERGGGCALPPFVFGRSFAVGRRVVRLPAFARPRTAEADALGRQLGLAVKLEAVKHLRPGTCSTRESNWPIPKPASRSSAAVASKSPGSGRPTGKANVGRRCRDRFAARDRGRAIHLAWRWVQRLLESRPGVGETNLHSRPARSRCGRATIANAGRRGRSDGNPARRNAGQRSIFGLSAPIRPSPPAFASSATARTSPPATRFELSTGDNELPCSLLALPRRIEAARRAMPFSRTDLGQRNARRLGCRRRRPTGRIGPRQPR